MPRQKVISEIMSGVEKVRIDTEKNLLDVLDKVHEITNDGIDPTHVFTLSQVYEGLLLKMGEKGSDAGQFFTPCEVIRAMVRTLDPTIGETVYDPCCGTGGTMYPFTPSRSSSRPIHPSFFLSPATSWRKSVRPRSASRSLSDFSFATSL